MLFEEKTKTAAESKQDPILNPNNDLSRSSNNNNSSSTNNNIQQPQQPFQLGRALSTDLLFNFASNKTPTNSHSTPQMHRPGAGVMNGFDSLVFEDRMDADVVNNNSAHVQQNGNANPSTLFTGLSFSSSLRSGIHMNVPGMPMPMQPVPSMSSMNSNIFNIINQPSHNAALENQGHSSRPQTNHVQAHNLSVSNNAYQNSIRFHGHSNGSGGKEENELILNFEDSCSVGPMHSFSQRSMKSVDFLDPTLLSSLRNHSSGSNLQKVKQEGGGGGGMEGLTESGQKRKSVELGNFLSSRRSVLGLGSSIRSQTKTFFQKMNPFRPQNKKKSRREKSETMTSECSADGSHPSNTSKSAKGNGEIETASGLNFEGGKHYSRVENIVLVGEIYTQLFVNPALKKKTWVVIAKNFETFFSENPNHQRICVRTAGALERHFKVLKEQNRKEGGTLFAEYYEEYRQIKQQQIQRHQLR